MKCITLKIYSSKFNFSYYISWWKISEQPITGTRYGRRWLYKITVAWQSCQIGSLVTVTGSQDLFDFKCGVIVGKREMEYICDAVMKFWVLLTNVTDCTLYIRYPIKHQILETEKDLQRIGPSVTEDNH